MSNEIRKLMKECGLRETDLAARLGVSIPTLSKKLKYDNWREKDLQRIAEVCGYECRIDFVKRGQEN